jgi:hypothetical protein
MRFPPQISKQSDMLLAVVADDRFEDLSADERFLIHLNYFAASGLICLDTIQNLPNFRR